MSLISLDATQLPNDLPTEIRLLQLGDNPNSNGAPLVLDADGLTQVIANWKQQGVDLPFDLDHQSLYAETNGQPAPAMGWFQPTAKDDGLYASNIKWTDSGKQYLQAKEYRYFSPTVEVDEDNRAVRLLPCALTNFPALQGIPALVAAKNHSPHSRKDYNPNMKLVLHQLGLPDDAEETKAVDSVIELTAFRKEVLALSGKDTLSEARGALQAMKQAHEQVASLSARVNELEADKLNTELTSLINAAVEDGRCPPAKKETLMDLGKRDLQALKTCLDMLPVLTPSPVKQPELTAVDSVLSDAETQVALAFGHDPKRIAALKHKKEGN